MSFDCNNSAALQLSIGKNVKLVPFPRFVLEPVLEMAKRIPQPPHERLVLESESRNLHDPSATSALCVCTVNLRKKTQRFGSTPVLHHPYLARQFATTENYTFTEYGPLGSLEEYLRPGTIVPVLAWATQICSALSYLHSRDIAHGHLAPSSVLVAEGGSSLRLASLESVTKFVGSTQDIACKEAFANDMYSLGQLFWFMENGDKAVPDHTVSISVQGLQLGDIILRCWAHVDARPSSNGLLRLLESLKSFNKDTPLPFESPTSQPPYAHARVSSSVRFGVVKLALSNDGRVSDSAEYFANEQAFIAQVRPNHPNIVRYFAVTDNFLFMQYYPLGSLEAYVKRDVHPPILRWMIQLCDALVYLHDLGYAHNQVYPCNILVSSFGHVLKLCDFETVTFSQDFVGGSYINPPEVQRAFGSKNPQHYKIRGDLSDVYSLGLIMWFVQNEGAEPPDNRILVYDDGCPYPRVVGVHSHRDILDVSGLFLGDLMRMCWLPQTDRLTSREVKDHLSCTIE